MPRVTRFTPFTLDVLLATELDGLLSLRPDLLLDVAKAMQKQLREMHPALQFYGKGEHMMQGFEDFETVSGESDSIECWTFDLCDEREPWGNREHCMTVENGGVARAALSKKPGENDETDSRQN